MKGKDCYDLLMMGETISGVYNINVEGRDQPLSVYCEMVNAGGGWTVSDASSSRVQQWSVLDNVLPVGCKSHDLSNLTD